MTGIVQSAAPMTLVGAGSLTKTDIIEARKVAPQCVAVDGEGLDVTECLVRVEFEA